MKPVGLQFHQSGGNRHFSQAQFDNAHRPICYPVLNQARLPGFQGMSGATFTGASPCIDGVTNDKATHCPARPATTGITGTSCETLPDPQNRPAPRAGRSAPFTLPGAKYRCRPRAACRWTAAGADAWLDQVGDPSRWPPATTLPSYGPILHAQPRNRREIAIFADDRTAAKAQGDCGNLHIDRPDQTTLAL